MAATLGQLITRLNNHARAQAQIAGDQWGDAALALGPISRALTRLVDDGLDADMGPRREPTLHLASACRDAVPARPTEAAGRLSDLAGGVSDVVGLVRFEMGREDRWALVVGLAYSARCLTGAAVQSPTHARRDLVQVWNSSRYLREYALTDPPYRTPLLDRPVPVIDIAPEMPPGRAAAEASMALVDALRRSRDGIDLNTALVLARVAELSATYAGPVLGLTGDQRPAALAAATWRSVRQALAPFDDGTRRRHQPSEPLRWATELGRSLAATLGPPDKLSAEGLRDKPAVDRLATDLRAIVNQMPAVADHLHAFGRRWAETGALRALAHQLPFREERLKQHFGKDVVVADLEDLAPAMSAVSRASTMSKRLAVALDPGERSRVGIQPHRDLVDHFRVRLAIASYEPPPAQPVQAEQLSFDLAIDR